MLDSVTGRSLPETLLLSKLTRSSQQGSSGARQPWDHGKQQHERDQNPRSRHSEPHAEPRHRQRGFRRDRQCRTLGSGQRIHHPGRRIVLAGSHRQHSDVLWLDILDHDIIWTSVIVWLGELIDRLRRRSLRRILAAAADE